MKTLTDEQVARLFDFCREHSVAYYDMQVELVDHMAAAIEEKMNSRPDISFEKALNEVFVGFGYKGFASVVETRGKQMQAANRRQVWSMFLAYFTWPKAMLTLLILTVLYVLQYYCPLIVLKWIGGVAGISLMAIEGVILLKQWLRYRKPTTPLLLLKRAWPYAFTSGALVNIYFNLIAKGINWLGEGKKPISIFSYNCFIIAFVLMLALVLAVYDTKKKVYYMARDKYPGAFTVPDITQ